MGLPKVKALNRFKSPEIFQGNSPPTLITLLVDAATIMLIIIISLDRDSGFDVGMRLVIENFEVFKLVVEDTVRSTMDGQSR